MRIPMGLRRLGILVWKNSILVRKRHWFSTLMEILIPLLAFGFLAYMSTNRTSSTDLDSANADAEISPQNFPPMDKKIMSMSMRFTLWYAPQNNFTDTLMSLMNRAPEIFPPDTIGFKSKNTIGFKSENEMLHTLIALMSNKSDGSSVAKEELVAFVVFEGEAASPPTDRVPKKLAYKIRIKQPFETDKLIDRGRRPAYWSYRDYDINDYTDSGFLKLQWTINRAFIELAQAHEKHKAPSQLQDQMRLQIMPYPTYKNDHNNTLWTFLYEMLPIITVASFFMLSITVIKRVVGEKQSGAKELMRMMGMENWTFWVGWLTDALLIQMLTNILIVWLLTYAFDETSGAILNGSSPTVIFFILMVFSANAIVFLFAISTFFNKPTIAMIISLVIFFLSLIGGPQFVGEDARFGFNNKMLMMIFPNIGLYFSFKSVLELENRGAGAQWSNLHESGIGPLRDISVLDAVIMHAVDIILYSVITWYISEVHPGEFGQKQPYFFFASKTYWLGEKGKATSTEDPNEINQENYERPLTTNHEDEKIGIIIRNLRKTYPGMLGRSPVQAVRGISLDIYKGEITALLGHNGAGKTTTMSILTGMISASEGLVQILGHNLQHDLTETRQSLGLCPQHNLLFGELTVHQHLVFFAMLKGNSKRTALKEAEELLATVRLDSKKDALVSELSGGMKRKLQLAIALIGGSKVVMLDEPTSGLDPEARREIWDLLLHLRKQRTILLSTHFMEEADVLGDTIAIMSHGNVECCGSTMYLKNVFGAGYHLNILKRNNCNEKELKRIVQEALPEAVVENSTQGEVDSPKTGPITFTLPVSKADKFPDLFDALENSKEELGIASIGVSVTTMEEIFLKVGELSAKKYDLGKHGPLVAPRTEITHNMGESKQLFGFDLLVDQLKVLILKKLIFTKRNWFYLLFQFSLPILMTVSAVWLSYAAFSVQSGSKPGFPISLSQYGSKSQLHVLYELDNSDKAEKIAKIIAGILDDQAQFTKVNHLSDTLIGIGNKSLLNYQGNYIVAVKIATVDDAIQITGLSNLNALHSLPIALNLISNALLKYSSSSAYQIDTINHPLPLDLDQMPLFHNYEDGHIMQVAIIWLFFCNIGWIFSNSVNLVLPLQERVLGARQLQYMTGSSLSIIWFSYFLVDVIFSTIVAIVALVAIFPFDTKHIFTSGTTSGVLFSVFLLYGIAGTVFTYFISFLKNKVASAFGFLTITSILIAYVNFVLLIMELEGDDGNSNIVRIIFGLVSPHFALASSLSHFSATAFFNSKCKKNARINKKEYLQRRIKFFT